MKIKPQFRERSYSVKIPNILGYKIHYVFSNDIQRSWLKRFDTQEPDWLHQAAGLHSGTESGHSWMFFPEDVGVSIMVHECWHAVYALMKWAGIPIDNNELIAYTLGFVVSSGQKFQQINDYRLGNTGKP